MTDVLSIHILAMYKRLPLLPPSNWWKRWIKLDALGFQGGNLYLTSFWFASITSKISQMMFKIRQVSHQQSTICCWQFSEKNLTLTSKQFDCFCFCLYDFIYCMHFTHIHTYKCTRTRKRTHIRIDIFEASIKVGKIFLMI